MVVRFEAGGGGAPVPGGGSFAVAPPPGAYGNGLGVYSQPTLNQFGAGRVQPSGMAIYMGAGYSHDRPMGGGGRAIEEFGQVQPKIMDASALVRRFEAMSNKKKEQLARKLAMAGYLTGGSTLAETVKGATLDEVATAYESLLKEAAGRFASGQLVSPDDILETNIRYNLHRFGANETAPESSWWKTLTKTQQEPEPFSGTKVSKNVIRDIYSASEARNLARQTLQNALGRDPTQAEYEDFVSALQTEQREHPVRQTTRTKYKDGEVVRTNTTSRGGVDVQQFAYEEARDNPGYAEWQAVGTYLPVVFNELGAGVAGV